MCLGEQESAVTGRSRNGGATERSTFLHHLQSQKSSACFLVWVISVQMCIYLWCHNCPTPKSFQLLNAHCGQLPVSSLSTSTQTTTLTLPVTHPGEVSFAARILYLDFHNKHNKYKRITSPFLSVYFNFMKSNKVRNSMITRLSNSALIVIMVNTTFLGLTEMVVMVLSLGHRLQDDRWIWSNRSQTKVPVFLLFQSHQRQNHWVGAFG